MLVLKTGVTKPVRFSSAGLFISDEGWTHAERVIDSYELIIVNKGTLYIEQGGQEYELNRGDVLIIQPGITHRGYKPCVKGTSFFWVHFYLTDNFELFNLSSDTQTLIQMSVQNNVYIPVHFEKANLERASVLCSQICHISESAYQSPFGTGYAATSLLIELSEQFIRAKGMREYHGNMVKILEWIRINVNRGISLSDVAYEFNYSKEYMSRYFHKNMGITMQKYINGLRISKAKEYLCQTDYQIKEIASLVGFNDEKYFLRLFQKTEQLTPKQFRNAYNRIHYNKK